MGNFIKTYIWLVVIWNGCEYAWHSHSIYTHIVLLPSAMSREILLCWRPICDNARIIAFRNCTVLIGIVSVVLPFCLLIFRTQPKLTSLSLFSLFAEKLSNWNCQQHVFEVTAAFGVRNGNCVVVADHIAGARDKSRSLGMGGIANNWHTIRGSRQNSQNSKIYIHHPQFKWIENHMLARPQTRAGRQMLQNTKHRSVRYSEDANCVAIQPESQ